MDTLRKSDERKRSLYLPSQMLKEVGEMAQRQDRSLSWVVRDAWKQSREYLTQGNLSPNLYTEDRERRSFYFPFEISLEIQAVGETHHRSISWLVTQAWIYSQSPK